MIIIDFRWIHNEVIVILNNYSNFCCHIYHWIGDFTDSYSERANTSERYVNYILTRSINCLKNFFFPSQGKSRLPPYIFSTRWFLHVYVSTLTILFGKKFFSQDSVETIDCYNKHPSTFCLILFGIYFIVFSSNFLYVNDNLSFIFCTYFISKT